MINLDDAIEFLKQNCDFQIVPDTTWGDDEFKRFTESTGLVIPSQLAEVLRRYGQCGTEYDDSFLVEYEDGSRSVHDVQVLVSSFDTILSRHETFISGSTWPDQFTAPMVFFGSADSGHSYLLMDGANPEKGTVYFWERATDPFGTGDNAKGLAKIADSLPEFFVKLAASDSV